MALPTGASPEVALPVPTVPELTLLTLEVLTRAQGTRQSEGQASPPPSSLAELPSVLKFTHILSLPQGSGPSSGFLSSFIGPLDRPLGS